MVNHLHHLGQEVTPADVSYDTQYDGLSKGQGRLERSPGTPPEMGWYQKFSPSPPCPHFFLVVWNMNCIFPYIFPIILGMSSSQLTNSYFSEGWLNHQPVFDYPILWMWVPKNGHDFDGFRGSGGEATVGGPSAAPFSALWWFRAS